MTPLQTRLLELTAASDDEAACLRLIDELRGAEGARAVDAVRGELRARREFDLMPVGVQAAFDPDPCYQTHRDDDLMRTVTTFRYAGTSPEALRRALLERPWSWWAGGRVQGWTRRPDGSVQFVLWPMWLRSPASFGVELEPPAHAAETSRSGRSRPKLVIESRFSGNFVGPGRYELITIPGGVVLRSVFDGVRRTGFMRLFPGAIALQLHLRAERGVLPFPFPRGTGFVHLAEAASNEAQR